jgi:hypothetical protein
VIERQLPDNCRHFQHFTITIGDLMTATTYTRSGSTFIASNRLILIVYTISIFVSAVLLFSVQFLRTQFPFISRRAKP